MIEKKVIPKSAVIASVLLQRVMQTELNALAEATREDLGITPDWNIDFDSGIASREVPEHKPELKKVQ